MILVTGGAGFIGSNFVTNWIQETGNPLINIDKLAYAGNLANLELIDKGPKHHFIKGDILDRELIRRILQEHKPEAVVHTAAETHVDRSIVEPEVFVQSNIVGTFSLLEETRRYWESLPPEQRRKFRFLHISTDEVFGTLTSEDPPFTESSRYAPNSPYASSKASADHLVKAYHHTYGLPTIVSNCSNNFGPYQFPEKLIPLIILNALSGKSLPIYGEGLNIRNWLYVKDHCHALRLLLKEGEAGEYYNIGSDIEMKNIDLVRLICKILDTFLPDSSNKPHEKLISYVADRPGHDFRYAINSDKVRQELGWNPNSNFEEQMRSTVKWYLDNPKWLNAVTGNGFSEWIETNYSERGEI